MHKGNEQRGYRMVRTADGIDHGTYHIEECLEAIIKRFEDGYILCPLLWCGGSCEECYEIFERRNKE